MFQPFFCRTLPWILRNSCSVSSQLPCPQVLTRHSFHTCLTCHHRGRHSLQSPLVEAAWPLPSHTGRACGLLGPTLQLSDHAAPACTLTSLLTPLPATPITFSPPLIEHLPLAFTFLSVSTPVIPVTLGTSEVVTEVVPTGNPSTPHPHFLYHPVSLPPSCPRHVSYSFPLELQPRRWRCLKPPSSEMVKTTHPGSDRTLYPQGTSVLLPLQNPPCMESSCSIRPSSLHFPF